MRVLVFYLKFVLNLSFFKVFNKVYRSDFSFFIILALVCILVFCFSLSFIFYLLFKRLFVFLSLVFRNLLNFFFKYFLSFILDFILSIYRIRFFLLLGSSYYDPLSKIFLDNLSPLKGEFLMDFYNFSNKFLFENDFNLPLSLFPKLPLFDSSKNSFLALFLSRLFLNILERQNKLRSYFFFVNNDSVSLKRFNNEVSNNLTVQSERVLSFFEFLFIRLNSVFIDFFNFVSLIQEYLCSIRCLSICSLLLLKYFSFLKNIFLAILVHLEVDSFSHYIHVNLYRMALQRYYNKDDWKNLVNTYDFSIAQSNAFSGDRRDDFFFFIKISLFYLILSLNLIFFYVFIFCLFLIQVIMYLRHFVSFLCDFRINLHQERGLFVDNLFFSFKTVSFVFLFFFKFFNMFCLLCERIVYYPWKFFRFSTGGFFRWLVVFDFFSLLHMFFLYFIYLLRVCFIGVYSFFFGIFFNHFWFSKLFRLFWNARSTSHYSFIILCFRNFREYFLYAKFRNAHFISILHSDIIPEKSLVRDKENIDKIFFLKECFSFSLIHLYFSKYCSFEVPRFSFLRLLIFRYLTWFLFWTAVSKHTHEEFLNRLTDKSLFYSLNYFNVFVFLNLLIDRFFFFLNYCFDLFFNLFSLFFFVDWRTNFFKFFNFLKGFFIFFFDLWKIFFRVFYNILFFFNLLAVSFLISSLIFFVFIFFYFVFVLKFVYFFFCFSFFWFLLYFFRFRDSFHRILGQNAKVIFCYLFFKVFLLNRNFYYKTIGFLRGRNFGFFKILAILFTIRNDLKKYEIIHRNISFSAFGNFYSDLLMNLFLTRLKSVFPDLLAAKLSPAERLPLLSFPNFRRIMGLPYQKIKHFKKAKNSDLKTLEIKNDFFVEFEYHKYLRSRNFRNLRTFRFRKVLEPLDFYKDPTLDALSTFDPSKNAFSNFDPLKFFYHDDLMFSKNLLYFREVFSRRNLSFFYDDLDRLSAFRLKYSKISPLFRYFYLKRERLKYVLTMHSFGNINNFSFAIVMNWLSNYRILRATLSILKLCRKVSGFPSLSYSGFHIFRFLFFMDKFLFFYNYIWFIFVFSIILFVMYFFIFDFGNFFVGALFFLFFLCIRFLKIFYELDFYIAQFYAKPLLFSSKLFCFSYFQNIIHCFFQLFVFTHFGLVIRLFLFLVFLVVYIFFFFGFQNIFHCLFFSKCFFLFDTEGSCVFITILFSEKCVFTFFAVNFCSVFLLFIQYFSMYFFFKIFIFKFFKILYSNFDVYLLRLVVLILLFSNQFYAFFFMKSFRFSPILLLKEVDLILETIAKENNYIKRNFLIKSTF